MRTEANLFHRPLAQWTAEALIAEYLAMNKAGFNNVFGGNARAAGNLLAAELLRRGIDSIPNPFGAIPVKPWK